MADDSKCLPSVSVIIPVFNDAKRLKLCLEALARQTYPQNRFEVIVVDNGSDPEQDIQGIVACHPGVILVTEAVPSSYAARNKGISVARGKALAFTDADCLPIPNWLEKGVARLSGAPSCGMVVGRIDVFYNQPEHPTVVELYQSLTAFPQKEHLDRFRGGATANVLAWREIIDRVGGFDSRLKSFGDFEWGKRVYSAGYAQVYADDAIVQHPARSTWQQLRTRTIRAAGGVYDRFMGQQTSWWQRNKMFARLLLDDLIPPVNFAIRTFREPRVKTIGQKFAVSGILLLVRYVSALEKLRLRFGGVSSRA